MRPIGSSYDNACSASEVSPKSLRPGMVYWVGEDLCLIWSSIEDSEDDDGKNALRMVGWPESNEEVKTILRESELNEVE